MKLPIPKELTVPMVYLKRGGLPRIIPAHHPEMIRRYDSNADRVVKRYLSCFSLAKEMKLSLNMRIREEESKDKERTRESLITKKKAVSYGTSIPYLSPSFPTIIPSTIRRLSPRKDRVECPKDKDPAANSRKAKAH